MMKGYIHSQESFGTVDGPGLRYVVFFQGCPMRCQYCHNPDTWEVRKGNEVTVDEILRNYNKNRSFYGKGGLTVTGGEPLLQIDFLLELFKEAKAQEIHTCIDTSGITYHPGRTDYIEKLDELMKYTDLVMLDIKHIDPAKHKDLTAQDNKGILAFTKYLEEKKKTQIALAVYDPSTCVIIQDGVNCGACSRSCPAGAIEMKENPVVPGQFLPAVNSSLCIGCGACEYACPAMPKAIMVKGKTVQTRA